MMGFRLSYRCISSFKLWSRGINAFSKAHQGTSTNVVSKGLKLSIAMMKWTATILIFSLLSCNSQYGVEFIIHNRSTVIIDSVRIATSDKRSRIKLIDIEPGQAKKEFLSMQEILKVDGHYHVEINTPGVTRINNIGYYTSESPIDGSIDIHYFDDSVKCNFKLKKY